MSTLTVTWTNETPTINSQWIVVQSPYAEDICTIEEMNNIIIPSRIYISNLPGYQSVEVTSSGTNLFITYSFDTIENANSANVQLYGNEPTKNTQVISSQTLISNYRKSFNVVYKRDINIS